MTTSQLDHHSDIYSKNIPQMIKIFLILVYTFCLKVLGFVMLGIDLININYFFYLLIFVMFIPEYGFALSKAFRNWLQSGIENGDGKLNKIDLTSLLMNYSTLWCIRLYVLLGLLEAFYGIQVREIWVHSSILGAFGIKAIEAVSFFKKK